MPFGTETSWLALPQTRGFPEAIPLFSWPVAFTSVPLYIYYHTLNLNHTVVQSLYDQHLHPEGWNHQSLIIRITNQAFSGRPPCALPYFMPSSLSRGACTYRPAPDRKLVRGSVTNVSPVAMPLLSVSRTCPWKYISLLA